MQRLIEIRMYFFYVGLNFLLFILKLVCVIFVVVVYFLLKIYFMSALNN